jgi:hypothetical protein
MPFETIDDFRSTFFEIDNGPAVRTLIIGPGAEPTRYAKTIAAIFRSNTQSVTVYDTDIEASAPSILCVSPDIADLDPNLKYTVRFLGLLEGEEGYGETFQTTPRISAAGVNTMRIYLKEL